MKRLLFALTFIINSTLFCQNNVYFHKYEPTASDWDILEWNITDTSNITWILKETVNSNGYVISLEFLKNGELVKDNLCYLANKVTFEYNDSVIIETLYSGKDIMLATDCEVSFKRIYHLDGKRFIEKKEINAAYGFQDADSLTINKWKEWVPEHVVILPNSEPLMVDYYIYSFAKMDGIYPVSHNYKIIDDIYYGDEPEKESIKSGYNKLNNYR